MMDTTKIMAALVDALNSSTRPPALYPLARIKYPMRELRPVVNADGSLSVKLAKWGYEYKHRGKKPTFPYPVDTAAIQAALNSALSDGYQVTAAENCKTYILCIIRRK